MKKTMYGAFLLISCLCAIEGCGNKGTAGKDIVSGETEIAESSESGTEQPEETEIPAESSEVPDLLLCTGHHGNQGLIRYQCLLQTEEGFVEEESFEEIANPAVDAENKMILSQWRNTAVSHSWAEYVYQDGRFVLSRELKEDLADEEIEDLIYNANSDWGISCYRWRTLYNQGLTTDYNIYGGP